MPAKGKIITNPTSGDTYEFLETANDSNGERVVLKTTLRTKGQQAPNHLHVLQEESFEVLSGQMTIWFGSKKNPSICKRKNDTAKRSSTQPLQRFQFHSI